MKSGMIFVPVLLLVSVTLAGSAQQTDWAGGPGVPGPVTDWGNTFDVGSDLDWDTTPGQLSLVINKNEIYIALGYSNPVIIGVMKDFHNDSFHEPIKPSALWYANWNGTINIRINGQDIPRCLQAIQQVWDELSPNFPFEYQFLDQTYNDLYRSEEVLHQIFTSFASMAIFIACLGLLGLISYSAQQRIKEIGIRKVMGSSTGNIIGLISKQYLLWVIIANAVALPLAALAMGDWLNHFAYRTVLTPSPFFWAGLSTLGIALFTVIWQAIRAAFTNPVNALKYE